MEIVHVKLRFEGEKDSIVKAIKYLKNCGVTLYKINAFYGEDEGKKEVRAYAKAIIDYPEDIDTV